VRQERARKADVEASARDAVEHRDFAGKLERMVEHRQHGAGDEAHGARALRHRRKEHDGVGAVAAVAREVVLDGAGVGEAELLRFLRDRKRFREVVGGALVGVVDGGKELHTELHLASCSRSARVELSEAANEGNGGTIERDASQSIDGVSRATASRIGMVAH
jgi:hypothetical protein